MSAQSEFQADTAITSEIPVLDAGAYFDGDDAALERLADAVRHAQEDIGFYFLAHHGVSADLIARTFDAVGRFFALPENEKLALKVNEHQIGYIPPKASILKTSGIENNTKPDTNEAFQVMRDRVADDPKVVDGIRFNACNQWPDEDRVPGLRATLLEYHDSMERLGWRMLPVYARALSLPDLSELARQRRK